MNAFPAVVTDFLIRRSIEYRSAAYLIIDSDNCLNASGGQLSAYGLNNLQAGENILGKVYFLEGILPLEPRELALHCLETASGLMADIHFFKQESKTYIVLLEAMLSPLQQRHIQQHSYELQLDKERRGKLLDQQLGRDQKPEGVAEEALLAEEGGRRTITVLSIMLKESEAFVSSASPGRIFTVIGKIFDRAIQSINAFGGMTDRIHRKSINAIFGFGESRLHPTQHAISAAEEFIKALSEEKKKHPLVTSFPGAAIGITSGAVNIGTLHLNQRKILTVFGSVVDLADSLAEKADRNSIWLDQDSFALSLVHAPKFSQVGSAAGNEEVFYRWQF